MGHSVTNHGGPAKNHEDAYARAEEGDANGHKEGVLHKGVG